MALFDLLQALRPGLHHAVPRALVAERVAVSGGQDLRAGEAARPPDQVGHERISVAYCATTSSVASGHEASWEPPHCGHVVGPSPTSAACTLAAVGRISFI